MLIARLLMRVLIAAQEFKGTSDAVSVNEALARGVARAVPGVEIDLAPMADGGPGTVRAVVTALGGRFATSRVEGPFGKHVSAEWGFVDERTAVIEMAAASGISLVKTAELDARRASTYGTGQLIKAALDAGCDRIIVGLGGSATNDGGVGALEALGARFYDASGNRLARGGAALEKLAKIDVSRLDPRLERTELILATDVTSPLLGARGASRFFGAQKGADAKTIDELESALRRFVEISGRHDVANVPGAGAAGGLAFGLAAFTNARVERGFDFIRDVLALEDRIARADVVITGEGQLDAQTAQGKGPGELAKLAKQRGKRTLIVTGRNGLDARDPRSEQLGALFDRVVPLVEHVSAEEAMTHTSEVLERVARTWTSFLTRASPRGY